MIRGGMAILLLLTLPACGQSKLFGRLSDPEGYWLPLTVDLRLDESMTDAALDYADACRQPQMLLISHRLQEALKREIGTVFERLNTGPHASKAPVDGAVEISLGLKEVDLFIPRQGTGSYQAVVTLGASMAYLDSTGATLYSKNLRTEARGTVKTEGQQCTVQGLAALADQAAGTLAQGFKKHLGTSTRIKEAALAGGQKPRSVSSAPPFSTTAPPASSVESASLSFRVMLNDDDHDQVLQSGEAISLEIELHNAGAGTARGVALTLTGTPWLVQQFTGPFPVGDVKPGETKRLSVQGTVPGMDAATQAEVIVSVEMASGYARLASQKKFQVALEPRKLVEEVTQTVDVDRVPDRVPGYERKKAIGIAVGVGAFQNTEVHGVRFAARDAEVMAEYFQAVAGVPPDRIRLATDNHALKDDLVEIFEGWLPNQVTPGGVVFVFLSGRALINPSTGGVSLIPHEADPSSTRRLFSLRRLYEALARLPIQRAVLMMDLALTKPLADGASDGKAPMWDAVPPVLRGEKLVQLIGVKGRQEAHQYEEGRHGLFTYYMLKGLRGEADRDRNGVVVVGELCGYVQEQVVQTAKEKFQNAQEPVCVLPLASKAKAWQFSLGRLK